METVVNIYEAKAHFSRLIGEVVKSGKPIVICRNRKPVVDVVPHVQNRNPLLQDPLLAGAVFQGDPCKLVDEEDWPKEVR